MVTKGIRERSRVLFKLISTMESSLARDLMSDAECAIFEPSSWRSAHRTGQCPWWWCRRLHAEPPAERSARPWGTLSVTADLRKRFGSQDLEPATEMTMTEWRRPRWLRLRRERATVRTRPKADGDLVREMPAFAAERIMEAEGEARTCAARGERSPMREVQRNGCRDRDWDTCAGRIALESPKLRKGSYFPVRGTNPRTESHSGKGRLSNPRSRNCARR